MTHRSTLRARLAPLALAGALALLSSVTACDAQQPSGGGERQAQAQATRPAVPTDSLLRIADRGRMKGAETAPVTILEVSDFQCPYCRQWSE